MYMCIYIRIYIMYVYLYIYVYLCTFEKILKDFNWDFKADLLTNRFD